jgi:hypothetical protein
MTIDDVIREFVRKRANYLCEYCHSPERICTTRFTKARGLLEAIRCLR